MLIKLTYLNNGNPTLVGIDTIADAYEVFEQGRGMKITKVVRTNGTFMNVLETPQEIMQMQMDVITGKYDPTEDSYEQAPVPAAPLDDRMRASYEKPHYGDRRKRYENNYNKEGSYNQNRY